MSMQTILKPRFLRPLGMLAMILPSLSMAGWTWGLPNSGIATSAGAPGVSYVGYVNSAGTNASNYGTGSLLSGTSAQIQFNNPGGLSVCSVGGDSTCKTPEHAMDNYGRNDSILFSFTTSVALSQVTIGWPGVSGCIVPNSSPQKACDTDITVLAYTANPSASIAPNLTLNTTTYSSLTGSGAAGGWSLINNYANLQQGTATNINPAGVTSKYWLVAAYISQVNCGSGKTCGLTAQDDFVKIASLQGISKTPGQVGQVPEPASLLLMIAGIPLLARRPTALFIRA